MGCCGCQASAVFSSIGAAFLFAVAVLGTLSVFSHSAFFKPVVLGRLDCAWQDSAPAFEFSQRRHGRREGAEENLPTFN
jgi:hypothetical protein